MVQDQIGRGLAFHRAGQLAEAAPLYQEVLSRQPDHAVALHLLGIIALQTGRMAEAVDWIARALAAKPDFPEALNNLGNAFKGMNQPDKAAEAYGRALALRPDFAEVHNNFGVCRLAVGRIDEAAEAFRRALTLKADYPEAAVNLAMALERLGRPSEAAQAYRAACALLPANADLRNGLGNALRAAGRLDDAAQAYGEAAGLRPEFVEFHVNHGLALTDCRRVEGAIAALRRALALAPGHPRATIGLGIALGLAGRNEESIACLEDSIRAAPDFAPAHGNLGLALAKVGRLEEAAERQRAALRLQPDYAVAHNNLALILTQLGKMEEAMASVEAALRLRPDFPEALISRGNLLKALGRTDEAIASLRAALALKPNSAEAHGSLGMVWQSQWRLDDAVAEHAEALRIWPDFPAALVNLGIAHQFLGLPALAAECYERILAAQPVNAMAFGKLLNATMYRDDLTGARIGEIHRRFGAAMARPLPSAPPLVRGSPDQVGRRLRIGYLSSDLCNHPVATNLLPVLRRHDRAKVSVHFYAHVVRPDAFTEQFKALADGWRDIHALTDRQAADLIRADEIDILVSLAGHFDLNRPQICAYRAAPIQISMHDVATSGLTEMDYLIGDGILLPRSGPEYFAERPLRLPSFYIADLPSALPPLAEDPRQGPAWFASFNNPAKISPGLTRLWGQILAAAPQSRLTLKYHEAYSSPSVRQRLAEQMVGAGARADQLEFLFAKDGYRDFIARYGQVDIALDTRPFSGSTTSFQALSMGIPVITLPGETMASRWTASMLRRVGLSELVATSPEHYVALAVKAAGSVDHWRMRRAEIRDSVRSSSLCDAGKWARNLERLYRAVWRRWCHRAD
ncbi:hypothetical protein CU669_00070 [Paramagnetospirillum kuznetsovii]|uniref:protein O-GlcNAc transferase n=1 Tax=Paramagnetospirillum kuznetsovii TaxID=2053833 RepID=A0A364P2P8_9PROT|nr:tetratricopeptide repeat protein [Paramagnetospirillum kuznetsovii]RAU23540.1 hypothetical protein CU669_00070 [Paramagnetospirillum kuznetsovii]